MYSRVIQIYIYIYIYTYIHVLQGDPTSPFWRRSAWDFFGRNDAKAETLVLWPRHAKSWLIGKDSDAGRDWGQEEKGTTEDEMAGWHHWLDGRESEWTPGVGDGQGGLACCDSWGRNWATELNWYMYSFFLVFILFIYFIVGCFFFFFFRLCLVGSWAFSGCSMQA